MPVTLPGLPAWTPPLNTGQPAAEDLNKLGKAPGTTVAGENSVLPITFGRDRYFGKLIFAHVDDTAGYLYAAYSFCEGEIDQFEVIYVDGVDISSPTGFLSFAGATYEAFTGTQAQSVSSLLNTARPSFGDAMLGTAYVVIRCPVDSTSGFPRVEAIIRGRLVHDPRKSALTANTTPALMAATGPAPTGTQPSTAVTVEGWVKLNTGWAADNTVAHEVLRETNSSSAGVRLMTNAAANLRPQVIMYTNAGTATRTLQASTDWADNEVHHIAFTYSGAVGARVMRLYVDGVLDASLNLAGESFGSWNVSWTGNPDIEIGVNGAMKLQDIRYWNVERTPQQIWDSHKSRLVGDESGLIGYWPIYEDTGSTLNDRTALNNDLVKDAGATFESAFAGLIPVALSPKAYSNNPTLCFAEWATFFTGRRVDYTSVIDGADFNDEQIGSPPQTHREVGLTMNKPNTASSWDKAWRMYMGCFLGHENGYLKVIPDRADVDAQGALVLSGDVSTFASIEDQNELDFGSTNTFTLEAVFKMAAGGAVQVLVGKKAAATTVAAGYVLYLNASNQLVGRIADSATSAADTTTDTYNDGLWHHAAMAIDQVANEMILTVDGVGRTPVSIAGVVGSLVNVDDFVVGANGAGGERFTGSIDEVRLWNVERTTNQLIAGITGEIMNPELDLTLIGYWKFNDRVGNLATDSSFNLNHLTVSGDGGFGLGRTTLIPSGVVRHFTADDVAKDSLHLNKRSARQFPTIVQVEYTDQTNDSWRTDRQQAKAAGVDEGTTPKRYSRVSLPGIHRPAQARREAVERLNWFLSDLEGSFSCFDEGLELQQGSVIAMTHPIGLDAKLFRVRGITGKSGRWTIDFTEYDPAIYSDFVIADPSTPDTNLGNPLDVPTVTSLNAVEELFRYRNGITGSRVRITWASGYPFASNYLVEGYVDGDLVWQTYTLLNEAVTPGVEELVGLTPVVYEVRVRIVTPFTVGTFASDSVTILGKLAVPSDVPNIRAVLTNANTASVDWDAATDIDIWRYELRVGTTLDTWETADFLVLVDGLAYQATGLPLGLSRIFIKAVDTVANRSNLAVFADVTTVLPSTPAVLNGFEVGGDVRLSWNANPAEEFVDRYRVTYVDGLVERTIDTVDGLRLSTKDLAEGSYEFRLYAINAQGESVIPATRLIDVSSDVGAFIADTFEFEVAAEAGGGAWSDSWGDAWGDTWGSGGGSSTINMHTWVHRDYQHTGKRFFVTNMGEVFDDTAAPHDFDSEPVSLANYHSPDLSVWQSEVHDFGLLLTGNWVLTHDAVALDGTINLLMELSVNGSTWDQYSGTSARGEYRYARIRFTSDGDSTAFVMTPTVRLHVSVVPVEESGAGTSNSSGPYMITLDREYSAVKEINIQPANTNLARMAVYDNLQIGRNTGVKGDGTNYYTAGDVALFDFGAAQNFTVELWLRHGGGTWANERAVIGKRTLSTTDTEGATSVVGWGITHNDNSGAGTIRFSIGDGSNGKSVSLPAPLEGEQGTYFAFTVDRTTDQIFCYSLDPLTGTVDQTGPISCSAVTATLANSEAFRLFADNLGGERYTGIVDEVRIWSDVRTPLEIEANFNLNLNPADADLIGYWKFNGTIGLSTGTVQDETSGNTDLVETGAGELVYTTFVEGVSRVNSFDVYVFDAAGAQVATDFRWNWKGI